jgi:hypothetical protein
MADQPSKHPVPKHSVVPMKVSAFQSAGQANSQLMPLFPYLHPGAIVPCTAALETDGSGKGIGYFVHANTVDEVAVTIGGDGPFRTGDVFVGPKEHGVGRSPPQAFFALAVITQRQLDEGEQPESVTFQCEDCATELYRLSFGGDDAAPSGPVSVLPTTIFSGKAASNFNADDKLRTCSKCGKENPRFPLPIWGWDRYAKNMRIAQRAWEALREKTERENTEKAS